MLKTYKAAIVAFKDSRKTAKDLWEKAARKITERMEKEPENADLNDLRVICTYLNWTQEIADKKRAIKKADAALDAAALAKYPELTEEEVKTLVVEDKWLATLAGAVSGEMDRISQALTQRVKELAERYETPLPLAAAKVTELEEKVNQHLEKMGFSWN